MQRILGTLVLLGAACWLCVYPVLLVTAGLLVLLNVDQGNELLDWTASSESFRLKAIFHVSVFLWSLSAWYCSRVLLQRRFGGRFGSPALEANDACALFIRKWLPRLLGGVIYVALAIYFFRNNAPLEGAVVSAIGVLNAVFVLFRRVVLKTTGGAGVQSDKLPRGTFAVLLASLALSFALFVAFLVSPVAVPRYLGAAPIILLAFTSWILFGSLVLVLFPKAKGWPSLAPLPLVLALIAGGVDNHELRRSEARAANPRADSIELAAAQWIRAHEADLRKAHQQGMETYPVYIAAAEGGGLRAAYWAASVLGELEDATGGRFSRHLFAISGVSGGSLGGAAFVAEVAGGTAQCERAQPASARNCTRLFLAGDFLAPVVSYLLFPDMVQRFLPVRVPALDRARALELSWEESWKELHPHAKLNLFAEPYHDLIRSREDGKPLPRLFLNATRVETGNRVLVSPAKLSRDEMPEVDDLLAVGGEGWTLPLSAAVHLSARFTYVSPAARICAGGQPLCGDDAKVWGRVVDGGYHENSGAQSAEGVLRALRHAWRKLPADARKALPKLEPKVVIITNDRGSTRVCDDVRDAIPDHSFTELTSPVRALWNSRTARGDQARRALADAAAGFRSEPLEKDCGTDRLRENTHEFALAQDASQAARAPKKQPALGWFLARDSVDFMHQALCREKHREVVQRVRKELGVTGEYQCSK